MCAALNRRADTQVIKDKLFNAFYSLTDTTAQIRACAPPASC